MCQVSSDMIGRFHESESVKQYVKAINNNESIIFFICKEKFLYSIRNKGNIELLNDIEVSKLKMSNLNELIEIVNDDNPLYPHKVFEKIFIIKKTEEEKYIKYPVRWEYYIE